MKSNSLPSILQALLAALFFGASAPLSKLLLGDISPVYLAAFLYLGSGLGITLIKAAQKIRYPRQALEAGIKSSDVKWLAGAILAGGIAAPILLMFSLQVTPASTASLLLNFEGVSTTLIALLVFREAISRRAWLAILAITLASILLSTRFDGAWALSPGAFGVIGACVLWGIDNNFTRNISARDPLAIVAWKGLVSGTFSFILASVLGDSLPTPANIAATLLLGWASYGLSTLLFIRAMRGLGAARTSALYGTAPVAGVLLSMLVFQELPSVFFVFAALLAIGGALLLVNEEHIHYHIHEALTHDHAHDHSDPAHTHAHHNEIGAHAHEHEHPAEEHEHDHMPDIHHRHEHEE